MIDDALSQLADSVWALPLLFALVIADALLVVVPGEVAVTAYGALAGVIGVAAAAAFCGDAAYYAVGRTIGLTRRRWTRGRRVSAARDWARSRMDRSIAAIVFTARFIPFARLAVNLTAGASRLPAPRFLLVSALAASAWAVYQVSIGAVVAWLMPGATVAAILVSIGIAVAAGLGVDLLMRAGERRRAVRGDGPRDH